MAATSSDTQIGSLLSKGMLIPITKIKPQETNDFRAIYK